MIKGRPPRLGQVFQSYDPALYFVTFCTAHRQKIRALDIAHVSFRRYALAGAEKNVGVGRYVILPDHVHLFVRGGPDFKLAVWVGGLKRAMSVAIRDGDNAPVWQPGFFDHLLRNDESYAQKWTYVRENPVRHGLVTDANDWPYQGEIVRIDRA